MILLASINLQFHANNCRTIHEIGLYLDPFLADPATTLINFNYVNNLLFVIYIIGTGRIQYM